MTSATPERPLRVAIIGSGPSGFYAAGHLLSALGDGVEVDMYERLPTPFGLVRAGVAPDHPKIKSVIRVYEKIAAHPNFRFFGNVEFGTHVHRHELDEHYHAVIYAVGTPTDRRGDVPGEDLRGSWAATEFVGWYNGHPDYRDLDFDLSCERAVVVGNGNVAMDVARMLVLTPAELAATDIADHALEVLTDSTVEEILVLGRRGPGQAAFTNPELRELGELSDADVVVEPADLDLSDAVLAPDADATARKNLEILREYAARPPSGHRKRIVLRFLASPVEIHGTDRVEGVTIARNELVPDPDGALRAHTTDERETVQAGLIFRAIGYRGLPLPNVPFDQHTALIPNVGGRVLHGGDHLPGHYVVGWIKRGPSGVIGTNKKDALETVKLLLEDWEAGRLPTPTAPHGAATEAFLIERRPDLVTYEHWQEIDAHEKGRGEPIGRPRIKLTRVEEMLDVLGRRREE
jgi:ferredoxin--NADP+ reductase